MSMDKVKELVASIKFNDEYSYEDNKETHRDLYDELVSLIPPDNSDSLGQPPPSLMFYAARHILYPSFIIGQIPELLNYLSTIDMYRQFVVKKTDEALLWQEYYASEQRAGRADDVRLLTEKETRVLQGYVTKKDDKRRVYIMLIRSLIQVHLHYIWTAPESCLIAKRLHAFFPGSFEGIDDPSPLQFHVHLSEEEKAQLGQLKEECHQWMNDAVDWAAVREEECRQKGLSEEDMDASYVDDFREAFPPLFEPAEMVEDVELYITYVEGMLRKLLEWFGPSP